MKTRKYSGRLVAQLRKIIGKSQSQFAAMVGVSKHTIISVENDRNKLSKNLARRIQLATGARILDKNFRFEFTNIPAIEGRQTLTPEALKFINRKFDRAAKGDNLYTREDFEQWRTNFFLTNDETARKQFDIIKIWVEYVFRAAAKPGIAGNRDRLPAVYQSLVEWLNETHEHFKLEKEVDDILEAETHGLGEFGFNANSLTNPTNPDDLERLKDDIASYGYDFAELKNFSKKAKLGDYIVLQTESRMAWDPFNWNESVPCAKWKILEKPKYWFEFGYDFMARIMKIPIEDLLNHQPELLAAVETLRHNRKKAAKRGSKTPPKS